MANVNSVSLSGVVDDDPVGMRTLEGGEILAFPLRVDGHVDDGSGNERSVDNFVSCRVTGKLAIELARVISKGSRVALRGTIAQPKRIGSAQVRPDAPTRVDVAEIDVLDAPCSGNTLKEAIGLNGYGRGKEVRDGEG